MTDNQNKKMTDAGGSIADRRRGLESTQRPASASQRIQVVRMNLFVLVRILFQYLEKVDPSMLLLVKEVSFMFIH